MKLIIILIAILFINNSQGQLFRRRVLIEKQDIEDADKQAIIKRQSTLIVQPVKNQKKGSSRNVTVVATSRNLKEAGLIRDKIQGILRKNTYVVTSLPRPISYIKPVVVKHKNNSVIVGPEPLVGTTNVKSELTSDVQVNKSFGDNGKKSQPPRILKKLLEKVHFNMQDFVNKFKLFI